MNTARRLLPALACALLAVAAAPTTPLATDGTHEQGEQDQHVCAQVVTRGTVRCYARVRTDAKARDAHPAPSGARPSASTLGNGGAYDPAYLQSAYVTPSATRGSGQTVAIVDAYDDPQAEADMGYYRSYFGLPACSTAGGCFSKVNQNGIAGSYPTGNTSWAQEISLDLDMASAICPNCHVLLVEANSNSFSDLATAVDTAVRLGASAVSNSYGGGEYAGETTDEAHYNHPGVAITVSSGDKGYGVEFPAASQYVTAVGGTSLNQATNTGTRNATETAWSGAGSGCSAYEPKPSFQHDTGCSRRSVADVSAVADPNTGVWVYDTYSATGWYIFGGTSVAAPIVASVYALAQNPASTNQLNSYPYGTPSALNDIVSGSNGTCGSYLCSAGAGYDGPTGLGSPNGTAAFSPPAPPSGTLSFATPPQTVTAGQASGAITVKASAGDTTVNLSSSSPAGTFAAASTGPWSSTLAMATTGGAATFYYTDTRAGSPTVSASATGYGGASQVETVTAGTLASLSVTPSSSTLAVGGTQTFTASAGDAYGNTVDATSTAWTAAGGLGGVSPATGGQTTFTATTVGTGGTVTAALGGLSAAASVTVTAAPDFSLSVSPSGQSVAAGSNAYYTVAISRSNGFGGAVSLSVNCPPNASCYWSSNPATGNSVTLRIRTRNATPRGQYALTVTGTSGSLTHSSPTFTLTVS